MEYRSHIILTCSVGKQKTSIKSYTTDFINTFANISIFPLIYLQVMPMVVFPLLAIDFVQFFYAFIFIKIYHGFYLFVLIKSFSFVSTSLVSFLFIFKAIESINIFLILIFYRVYSRRSKWVTMFYVCNLLLKILFNLLL